MTSSFCIGRNMQRHDNLRMVIMSVQTSGGGDNPPHIGLASNVSPPQKKSSRLYVLQGLIRWGVHQ